MAQMSGGQRQAVWNDIDRTKAEFFLWSVMCGGTDVCEASVHGR